MFKISLCFLDYFLVQLNYFLVQPSYFLGKLDYFLDGNNLLKLSKPLKTLALLFFGNKKVGIYIFIYILFIYIN